MPGLLRTCLLALFLLLAGPALAADTLADVPKGRLPDLVRPTAYRLDLTIDPRQAGFSGSVDIDAVLARETTSLFLHGRDLAVARAEAVIGGQIVAAQWQQVEETGPETGIARLMFARPLPPGPLTLRLAFAGRLGDSPSGLYRVKVDEDWYVWSQFQSIDARAAFPAFDEPGFKTPFTLTLRTPPGMIAIGNAPEASLASEGGLEVHRFAPTLPLPTYLVAMAVGPFAVQEGHVPPTPQRNAPLPLRVLATRGHAGKLGFALDGSQAIVARLEDWFGAPFPFPKLDQIASPVMPGAMENAGADIYGDAILLVDEASPVAAKRRFGMVVAHELAHQWFGDLVTPAWWDDIWLNESFANWMGYRIGAQWRPDLKIEAGALAEGFEAMPVDSLSAGRPIRQDIADNSRIDAAFDAITYGKGGHVVGMIAGFMGEARFLEGVHRYMAAHRHGSATSADFFAAMAEASGDSRILPAMQGFIGQQGVPLLTFTGSRQGRLSVSQSRYAALGMTPPASRWSVPLCLRQGTARACRLLDTAEANLDLTSLNLPGKGAVMPNAGGTGYYRFELPRRAWNRLIAEADRLPAGEALALADSLEASFRAGRASVRQLAALAGKLARNPDGHASAAATRALRALIGSGVIGGEAMPAWRRFVLRLYAPVLARLGFDPRAGAYAGEAPDRTQRRLQAVGMLATKDRNPALAARLRRAGEAWLAGDRQALDPAWYGPAFAAMLDAGGMEAAKRLVDAALASQDAQFRPVALDAVAASGQADIARWLLEDLRDPRLREQERRGFIAAVIQTGPTQELGYRWLNDNLDGLLAGSGGIFFRSRLPDVLSGFCSAEWADAIARDFGARIAGSGGELALERAIEQVRTCGMLKDLRGGEATRQAKELR